MVSGKIPIGCVAKTAIRIPSLTRIGSPDNVDCKVYAIMHTAKPALKLLLVCQKENFERSLTTKGFGDTVEYGSHGEVLGPARKKMIRCRFGTQEFELFQNILAMMSENILVVQGCMCC